jgi:hypothetical protein
MSRAPLRTLAGALALAGLVLVAGCGGSSAVATKTCPSIPGAEQAAATSGPGSTPGGNFFAPGAVWNQRLAKDAPVDPASAATVGALARMAKDSGSSVSIGDYAVPLYRVGADQRCVKVQFDGDNAQLRDAFAAVPLPSAALPAAGTDAHLALWQPATDTYWEFFRLRRDGDGWHARYGGRIVGMSKNPGHFTSVRGTGGQALEQPWWGATATSLPLVGGLVTFEDLARGRIDHALSFAVPRVRRGVMAAPAQRSDGRYGGGYTVPEGARFRIDPSVNLDALHLSPFGLMLAKAAQRYGMIVRDGGSRVAIYAQSPLPGEPNPYPALLGRDRPDEVLHDFPWSKLRLMRMDLRPDDQ